MIITNNITHINVSVNGVNSADPLLAHSSPTVFLCRHKVSSDDTLGPHRRGLFAPEDESLARLRGVPALALEWLPGLPIAVYHIMNTYGVHPDGALLENVAVKYHLREQLANGGADYVIHGVVVGPDIQGNPLGLTEYTLYGLDVYDASEQHWLDWNILQ